ncbi:YfhD-like protein [Lentibacillus persicus]|uniref:YfhD-like protein n=1 Tax=Lentibacillus persicus TaxID=640948 RepID=A0A1I1YB95_9BACI|nr:YfhD family protein [Lentibacillus persicus]SFE16895.1 YfhD-like protein [Lentibacillus persicus]
MGRDEHRTSRRGRARLAQTPKYAKTDSKAVEFSEEFGDHHDKIAQVRRRAAEKRVKNKKV